jgi:hypothetical protein
LIGGFLSRPSQKFPIIFDNVIFKTFPYFLPNFILFLISIVGFVLCFIFLKETLNRDEMKEIKIISKDLNVESTEINVELDEISSEKLKESETKEEEIVTFTEEIKKSEEQDIQQEMLLKPTEIKIETKVCQDYQIFHKAIYALCCFVWDDWTHSNYVW